MQTTAVRATPTLNEWASFLGKLNSKKTGGQPFLTKDVSVGRMMAHLDVKLSEARRYSGGRQLRLFARLEVG